MLYYNSYLKKYKSTLCWSDGILHLKVSFSAASCYDDVRMKGGNSCGDGDHNINIGCSPWIWDDNLVFLFCQSSSTLTIDKRIQRQSGFTAFEFVVEHPLPQMRRWHESGRTDIHGWEGWVHSCSFLEVAHSAHRTRLDAHNGSPELKKN